MRYIGLACDFDGTLAHDGQVDDQTIGVLQRLRETGRKLILVTGRQLDELASIFPHLDLFHRVVGENGALLATPGQPGVTRLAEPPPPVFVTRLQQRGVSPMAVGEVIVATWRPQEMEVLAAIRELGLELQVIFNKDAVMVLPPGVNKASGLAAALADLALSPRNVVAVGDAENDHALLQVCECGVAVANALPMLKERADLVTIGERGAGVSELAERLIANDLADLEPVLTRHQLLLGTSPDGREVRLPAYGRAVLLTGPSGGGKTTLTNALLERISEHGYQFCLIDPEGDYEGFQPGVALGGAERAPAAGEVMAVLETPGQNAIVNLTGVPLNDRPAYFQELMPRLQEMRARTARPNWIVLDEVHHLLPTSWHPATSLIPQRLSNVLMVSLEPGMVAPAIVKPVRTLLLLGQDPVPGVSAFSAIVEEPAPTLPSVSLAAGEAVVWQRDDPLSLTPFTVAPPRERHRRHRRKYAEGALIDEERFVFRGPRGELNLHAENLRMFVRLAEGVDEATWTHHLERGEYSQWFRDAIKDDELSREAEEVERAALAPAESRARIKAAIERRYTV
jgi:hydroxymethylpyrimidine pyrophosphatase-like HAD family hydrolase/energy-coupling factor transporter ATP-binding protein EcfA2